MLFGGSHKLRAFRKAGAIFLLALACFAADAEIKQSQEIKHYPVKPQAGQSLKDAMRASTPIQKNNRHWYGETQWQINPLYRVRRLSGGCYVNDRIVELAIVITLPELQGDLQDREIQQQFKQFYEALLEHELGHQELGVAAANAVDAYLAEPNIFADCKALYVAVNEKVQSIIDKYQSLNQQYDEKTQHGKTQGAVITGAPAKKSKLSGVP